MGIHTFQIRRLTGAGQPATGASASPSATEQVPAEQLKSFEAQLKQAIPGADVSSDADDWHRYYIDTEADPEDVDAAVDQAAAGCSLEGERITGI